MYTQEFSTTVECDFLIRQARCDCSLFAIKGIPCRHLICFLTFMGITRLPNYFICKKWMQCHNRRNNTKDFGNTSLDLFHLYTRYSKIAKNSEEKKVKVKEYLTKGLIAFDEEIRSNKGKEV